MLFIERSNNSRKGYTMFATTALPLLSGKEHAAAALVSLLLLAAGYVLPQLGVVWMKLLRNPYMQTYILLNGVMYTASACLNITIWPPGPYHILLPIDRVSIYVVMGAVYIPVALYISEESGRAFFRWVWTLSAIGATGTLLATLCTPQIPDEYTSFWYIVIGMVQWVFFGKFVFMKLPSRVKILVGCISVIYLLGGIVFALHFPNLWPEVIGYHVLFHLFTIAAEGLYLFSVIIRWIELPEGPTLKD